LNFPWGPKYISCSSNEGQGSNHVNKNQCDYFRRIMGHFLILFIFSCEGIFEWNLLQLIIKNTYSCFNITFFLINNFWINMIFSKCAKFSLKIYHNLKSNKNMRILLVLVFFCIIIYNFLIYIMHITPHLIMINDYWKFEIYNKHILNFQIP